MNNGQQRTASELASERRANLSRRRFLRGVGACIALPAFESLMPRAWTGSALGAEAAAAGGMGLTASGMPLRMAFMYIPNGVNQANWWPTGEGKAFKFGPTMSALEPLKDQVQVVGGLDQVNAISGPDGAGDHARANGTFLTSVRVRKTA